MSCCWHHRTNCSSPRRHTDESGLLCPSLDRGPGGRKHDRLPAPRPRRGNSRFSRLPTHSRVRSADWVGAGIDDRAGSQASKLLPLGNPATARREWWPRTGPASPPALQGLAPSPTRLISTADRPPLLLGALAFCFCRLPGRRHPRRQTFHPWNLLAKQPYLRDTARSRWRNPRGQRLDQRKSYRRPCEVNPVETGGTLFSVKLSRNVKVGS